MAEMSDDGIQLAQVIRELKDHIGKKWKAVARELEFSTTDVDAIVCRDEHDLKEQIHRFFEQWKMREGSGASVQKLIEAVRAAGLRTILDDLQRALPELECGGIMPVQETAPTGGTPTSERDLVRMKRLQKMSISDDPSFQPSSSPGGPRRSASSQTAAKNSEPSPIKAGVSSSFEVGQVVKVDHKPKPWYGVIKYIGPVTDCPGTFAGVEMDEVVEGGHAGKFGGKRYFTCNDGYGLMLPRSRLNLDDRFDPPTLKGGSVGGDDVERDKNMPSTPTQPTASRKPSDPLSPDLMKGDAAKPTQKEMPGVFESTDSPETSGGGEVRLLAFECAGDVAGFVIGRDGKNRRDVESKTDTRIRVEKKEGDTAANTRVIIMGKKENCQKALLLIVQNLRRKTALHTATTETIDIPSQHCGRVIGRKGANVRAIENLTGTRINIEQPKGLDVFLNFEAVAKCKITGSAEQIEKAKEMVRKSVEGSDIAGAAFIAAFMLKFMKEIKAEGHTFE